MCGLVGAFRADDALFTHKITNFMEKGLYVSAVRGVEGTGVGLVSKDFVPGHAKSQFDASTFLQTRQYGFAKKAMIDARVILGHTRHSTVQGSISQENAHPFQWRNGDNEILFTHNGHISNAHMLSHKNFHHQVDSAHVANALLYSKDVDVLQEMTGFYVCIWFDRKSKTLKMARNNSRDLYYVYNKAKTQIYYASEAEILKFILDREEIETEDEFHEIEPGKLLVWDLAAKTLANPTVVNYTEKKSAPHWQGTQTSTTTTNGSTSGAGTGGTSGRSFGGYGGAVDPIGPARFNDLIYMQVKNFSAFISNGTRAGVQSDPHPEDWGYIFGQRISERMGGGQKGSIIKCQVQRKLIDDIFKHIPDRIPVQVNRATLETADEDGNKLEPKDHYWYYECNVDTAKARLDAYSAQRRKQEKEAQERAREGASDPLAGGSSTEPTTQTKAVVPFVVATTPSELVPGPGPNNRISMADWMAMADEGCFFCEGQLTPADVGRVSFYKWPKNPEDHDNSPSDYQIICPLCKVQCNIGDEDITIDDSGSAVIQPEVASK